jgi:MinD-like ATPase involved in chromosome partitioning or flagellar assembly
MPSLQSTALALQELARLGVEENKIGLILNHVTPQGDLPMSMIQKAIKRPILFNVPYEADMIKSVNSGKPLMLSYPKSAGARAIARLANTLV